jgi:hypothetical protein
MSIHMFKTLDGNTVTEWDVTYKNRVLYDGERNYHDDSDFYAIVWDDELGEMRNTVYASTRGWSYPNHVNVDFTPESDPEGWANMVATLREKLGAEARELMMTAHTVPKVGDEVRVVNGPGKDTLGTVFWTGYGRGGKGACRLGMSPSGNRDGEAVWTLLDNVEKTLIEITPEDEAELEAIPDEKYVRTAISNTRGGYGCFVI